MAKGAWIGIGDKARKIKKSWIGVDNKARKVKKMWIGIGGVAKLFFSSEGIDYYKTMTLGTPVYGNRGASSDKYAFLVGGGYNNGGVEYGLDTVEAYNASLTKTCPTGLTSGCIAFGMTGAGSSVVIAGGISYYGLRWYAYRYNDSLTKTTMEMGYSPANPSATCAGSYVLVAGGDNNTSPKTYFDTVVAISSSNTVSYANNMVYTNTRQAAEHVGGYALFTGGSVNRSVVVVYNSSLTASSGTELSEPKYSHGASYVGDRKYAVFAGGAGTTNSVTVDAFNSSLTKTMGESLSQKRFYMASAHLHGMAIFAGGVSSGERFDIVEAYDESLTKKILTPLTLARNNFAGASVGDFALFAGGATASVTYNDTIDVYQSN